MAMPGIVIRVSAATKDAISDLAKVDKALGKTATSSQKANAIMGRGAKIAAGALAGAAAVAGGFAVKMGVDGVKSAIDDQAAQKKLAQTLKNNGFKGSLKDIEAHIDALQQATGVADDELRPAYGDLYAVVKDTATANDLLAAAMDLAAAKGIPLEEAAKKVAKAAAGSASALERIAPELGKISDKGDPAAATLEALNKQFGGQQAAKTATMAGKLDAVQTAVSELGEAFGTGLIGDVDDTTTSLGDLTTLMYDNRQTAEDFGAALHSIAEGLLAIAGAYSTAKEALENMPGADWIAGAGDLASGPLGWMVAQNPISAGNARQQAALAAARASAGGASTDVYTPTVDYNPVLWQQQANVAAARANGRAAQKQARTGSRP